ncbi:hypothetical protein MMC22_001489 [Lobaria immixta]|nr:hypothetical protein [Lobaria immixta]
MGHLLELDFTAIPSVIRRYSEAINILYSCNIFGFPNTNYLIVLPKLLIPPHFNAIRSLNFTMRLEKVCPIYTDLYPSDRGDQLIRLWASQWKNIASMEGLRELRVRMKVPFRWRGVWIREQILLLEPLKQITKLKVFVLTLPFQDPAENESALQKLPCQIQRARIGTYG